MSGERGHGPSQQLVGGCMRKNSKWMPLSIAIAVLLFAPAVGGGLAAQSVETELDQVSRRLEAARASRLDVIAPRAFERAQSKFAEARSRFARGGRIDEIRRMLRDVETSLDQASEYEEIGKVLLRDALTARDAALAANAPEYALQEWQRAEEAIKEAGRRVERGDQNGAREQADRAATEYLNAEFQAIRRDLLGKAQETRAEALRVEAHKKAAHTFSTAESYLQQAEAQLQGDRYARNEAARLARAASNEFRHAMLISALVDEVDRNKRSAVEKLVLDHEAQFARIAMALNFEPSFSEGVEPVTDQILEALQGLYTDRDNLRADLAERMAELAAAERRGDSLQARLTRIADSLGGQLAMVEQRERRVAGELRERQRREQTLRRIRNMFSPDDAELVMSGDELVIRLYGLSFPVGSAEIRPANFSLLTGLQRALREFPGAPVTIEGHTDSQGNDQFNQALSQRRAEAVRQYLIANMGLDETTVTAVGFGESRPIANNETAEGRAKNRRIDVRIHLTPTS